MQGFHSGHLYMTTSSASIQSSYTSLMHLDDVGSECSVPIPHN